MIKKTHGLVGGLYSTGAGGFLGHRSLGCLLLESQEDEPSGSL